MLKQMCVFKLLRFDLDENVGKCVCLHQLAFLAVFTCTIYLGFLRMHTFLYRTSSPKVYAKTIRDAFGCSIVGRPQSTSIEIGIGSLRQ